MNIPIRTNLLCLAALCFSGISAIAGDTPGTAKEPAVPGWKWGDPLSVADGRVVFDGEIRERFEWRDNWIDFNDAGDARDDVALLQRLRVGLKFKPAEWFSAQVQMQDSRTWFDEPGGPSTNREFVVNDSPADLRQAWVEFSHLAGQDLSLRAGRQVLSYGKQRLIGGFEWDNNARTFDAVRSVYKNGPFSLDLFAGYVVLHKTGDFNNSDSEDLLTGAYANYDGWNLFSVDAYAIGRSKSDLETSTIYSPGEQTDGNTSPAGDYVTLGTLWKSREKAFGPVDFNMEWAAQFGGISNPAGFGPVVAGNPVNTARQDLLAFASHVEAGYTFAGVHGKPRFHAEYNYSTGDGNPANGTSNTFQNLFPTNHLFYGDMDRFSWQNMHNIAAGWSWLPMEGLNIKMAYHLFWLADVHDVWRFAGQGPVGGVARYGNALNRNPSSFVGSEINLNTRYTLAKGVSVEGGWAHFFAGDYIGDTAPAADDADFAYVQMLFQF